ncbi:hypothetical protein IQ255_24990 [Pleurocapsales cyanobacterium LEGE 10410]|nr:hypothetical protein [Pleurocapsales cyanobacterium LEGE 10410]
MKLSPPSLAISHIVDIKDTQRWQIYRRLQELDISCRCSTNQPLIVEINSSSAIAQLTYVVRQLTASRSELIDWLNNCWQVESKQIS